ncbi:MULTISPECIES: TIGR04211 family SH3 domain-containing protein [Salinivibrio]|uniref:TIGR04211 family SH3 domain-containing protein n=1 Tax=Salinivibrio TaxID=51366 RepID=UPI00084C38AA|nr:MULTISPECIES: TIGR04211 family SH3 domain-containing protein [Salinivibrio]ODP96792.1 arylsulfatase [Salinivibrio sp. DV]OOF12621.1 arylsulfatase [Salinivibrio sp. PR5]OOF14729.1 arylsulfatase [Salinivibrio sp. PR932]OOF15066.1 arylsulfatase [Salinivibrio sp. PR919]OOF30752.1 arylsulfatase [Salinivibrio proteolyticus]
MKHLYSALMLLIVLVAPRAMAENYISDELFTYMHSGPGTQYRIIGSVDAGDKITVLSRDRDAGYTQVVDSRGRKGWVKSDYVTTQPGLKERLPALEAELKRVKSALASAQDDAKAQQKGLVESLAKRNEQISKLEAHSSDLNKKLIEAQSEIRALRAKIDTQKDDLLMRWFTYGGMVAGGGLLFGLVLPHLIPRKKRRRDGWA